MQMNNHKAKKYIFDSYVNKALKKNAQLDREAALVLRWLESILSTKEICQLENARSAYLFGNGSKKQFFNLCGSIRKRLFTNG